MILAQRLTGAAAAVAAVSLLTAPALPGQEPEPPVSLDSASAIRDSLRRPPPKPPADFVDVVEFPFKLALFPLVLVVRTVAAAAGLAGQDNPPFPVRQIRAGRAWGLTPKVRSIGPGSGPALLLELERFQPLVVEGAFSIVGSQRYRVGFEFGDKNEGLSVLYEFRRDAEDNFWGVGSRTPEEDRSDFLRDRQEWQARGWFHAAPFLVLEGGVAFENNRVDRGKDGSLPDVQDTFEPASVFGLAGRTKFVRLDFGGKLDFTRLKGFQPRGVSFQGSSSVFRGSDGTDSDFHRFTAEFHGYLPLNSRQYLAVRGLAERNRLDDGVGIPFFDLARFGGSHNGPRAFSSGRFRDRDGFSLMFEWRYEIWEDIERRTRAEAFVLFDEGGVTHRLSDLSGKDLRSSYGFGLRLLSRRRLLGLGYVAFSGEGTRVTLKTHWPF